MMMNVSLFLPPLVFFYGPPHQRSIFVNSKSHSGPAEHVRYILYKVLYCNDWILEYIWILYRLYVYVLAEWLMVCISALFAVTVLFFFQPSFIVDLFKVYQLLYIQSCFVYNISIVFLLSLWVKASDYLFEILLLDSFDFTVKWQLLLQLTIIPAKGFILVLAAASLLNLTVSIVVEVSWTKHCCVLVRVHNDVIV